MELKKQLNNPQTNHSTTIIQQKSDAVISIEECRQYVAKFDLDDQKIYEIRNILIGIANKTINSYLESFR